MSDARRTPLLVPLVTALIGCRGPSTEPAPPRYPPPLADGDAVFFVGNSFMAWDGRELPQYVAALGEASDPPIHLEVAGEIVPGELPLAAFLPRPGVRAALASGRYDVFVLQGFEYEPVDDREGFHAAVRAFDADVRAAGGRTVLFMTWEFSFRPFIDELADSYATIARELQIPVIPTGLVFHDCGVSPPPGEIEHWLTTDAEHPEGDIHPNAAGMAASALTTFAILTGRDPRGLPLRVTGNTLDDARLRLVAEHAWARAAERLQQHPHEGER